MPENQMAEGQGASLFNHETNVYEWVPANDLAGALASGKYSGGGTTESVAGGGTVVRPVQQLAAAQQQGETSGAATTAKRAAGERHEQRLGALSDPVLTFSEGMVDALTLGLVHGTDEKDEFRRQADSGSALLGQIAGTVMGLGTPGLVEGVTKGGTAAGRAVARALIKDLEGGAGRVFARGLEEAGANAALMAASSFGHQITDAVIADKPFAAEVIGAEAGLGAVLGFGAGWLGSSFGRLARSSRGAVEASGVAVKETEAALSAVDDVARSLDGVVETHAQRLGVLEVLSKEGHVPEAFMAARKAALSEAEAAGKALRDIDAARAIEGEAKGYQAWRNAVERYDGAVRSLDEVMTPAMLERAAANPVKLGERAVVPPARPFDTIVDAAGQESPMSRELDALMTPEKRAAYEQIYGRPYEDLPPAGARAEPVGSQNMGGKVTPTSEQGTAVGKRRAAPNDLEPAAVAKNAPATPAQNGERFAEFQSGGTAVEQGPRPPAGGIVPEAKPRSAVQQYLDDWFREAGDVNRVRPVDQVNAKLEEALGKLSGSRLDNAGSLELGESLGLQPATGSLGQRLDQVWSMRQAGKFAADEARGVATPLRGSLLKTVRNYALRKVGRKAAGAAVGGAFAGPLGAILGYAMTSAGFAGSVASAAGKMASRVASVGEALLRGPRATVAARVVAGNRPYQYGTSGPISDPVERIQELHRLASDPVQLRAQVRTQLGDLTITSPELSSALEESAVRQVSALSASAPAIYLTPTGRPINPTGTAMRAFLEFENAMHDLPGLLSAVESGSASRAQIGALQMGFPAVYAGLTKAVLNDEQRLRALPPSALKSIERVLGFPLTRAGSDPEYTSRFQTGWYQQPQQPPGRPQAFKITAPPGTSVQSSSSGRAPGNER